MHIHFFGVRTPPLHGVVKPLVKTRNAGLSRNMPEYITRFLRNIPEYYAQFLRNMPELSKFIKNIQNIKLQDKSNMIRSNVSCEFRYIP